MKEVKWFLFEFRKGTKKRFSEVTIAQPWTVIMPTTTNDRAGAINEAIDNLIGRLERMRPKRKPK